MFGGDNDLFSVSNIFYNTEITVGRWGGGQTTTTMKCPSDQIVGRPLSRLLWSPLSRIVSDEVKAGSPGATIPKLILLLLATVQFLVRFRFHFHYGFAAPASGSILRRDPLNATNISEIVTWNSNSLWLHWKSAETCTGPGEDRTQMISSWIQNATKQPRWDIKSRWFIPGKRENHF